MTSIPEVIFVHNEKFYLGATAYSEEEDGTWKDLVVDLDACNTILISGDRFAREYKEIQEDKNRYEGLNVLVYLPSEQDSKYLGINSVKKFEKVKDYVTEKVEEALKDPESVPSYNEEETIKRYVEDYLTPYTGLPGGACNTAAASCNFIYKGKLYMGGVFLPDEYSEGRYKNNLPDVSAGLQLYPISAEDLLDSVMNYKEVIDADFIVIINDDSLKECEIIKERNNENDEDDSIEEDDYENEAITLPLMNDLSDKKTNPCVESVKQLNRKLDLCIFAHMLALFVLLAILKYVG